MVKTDGQFIPLCRECSITRAHPKAQALCAIPAGTKIGPVPEVHIVTILEECGIEVAIPSPSNPENTYCVVISNETERCVNEIHTHSTDARSSKELLENIQEPEEKVTTRFKETWADPSALECYSCRTSLMVTQLNQNWKEKLHMTE